MLPVENNTGINATLPLDKQGYYQQQANLARYFHERIAVKFYPICEAEQVTAEFVDAVMSHYFTFNNETHCFGVHINWLQNPSVDIEWHILLHKGYYLVGLGKRYAETADQRYLNKWVELTESWIAQVSDPGFIASDVTGRRLQNWIYAFYYFVHKASHPVVKQGFLQRFLASIYQQVEFLINNLAQARNHRTLELTAIFLAAVVFPEFDKADEWLRFSLEALADNAEADILADGVHCELSTFYHHIVLKNLLTVKRLADANRVALPARFDNAIRRALNFSLYIHKPDGSIPSLSDGDIDCFHDLLKQGYHYYGDERLRYIYTQGKAGTAPEFCAKTFVDSGYSVLRSSWYDSNEAFTDARYLVFDCGSVGAGNHGHFDVLNIEVAAYGHSLIVDPGRYTYDESGPTNWRVLFRSTRYHNTVEVDGKNQVNYAYNPRKGKFKIQGPHSQPELCSINSANGCHLLDGKLKSHEYSAIHQRKIFFVKGEYWFITDILTDQHEHHYALRYHLSAMAQNQTTLENRQQSVIINSPHLLLIQPFRQNIDTVIEQGFVSSEYGVKQKAPVIKYHSVTAKQTFHTLLIPYKNRSPQIALQTIETELEQDSKQQQACTSFSVKIQKPGQESFQELFFIAQDGQKKKWKFAAIECEGFFCYLRLNERGGVESFYHDPQSSITIGHQLL